MPSIAPVTVAGLPRREWQFTVLVFSAAVASLSRSALNPLQEAVRVQYGVTDNAIALLQGAALALPMMVLAVPIGTLVDRYPRVRLLALFSVADAAGAILTALAPTYAWLFAARCLVGGAIGGINTIVFSSMADLFAPSARGRASMILIVGQYLAMSAAFAAGGMLLGRFPGKLTSVFLVLSVPLVVACIAPLLLKESPRSAGVGIKTGDSSNVRFGNVRSWLPLLFGLVLAELAIVAALTWASPAFKRELALSDGTVGVLVGAALLLSGALGPLLGGLIADRAQRVGGLPLTYRRLALLSALASLAGLFALAPTAMLAAAGFALFTLIVGAVLVAGIAAFTIVVPEEVRGRCISLLAAAQLFIGVAIAPLSVSGLIKTLSGPRPTGEALCIVAVSACLLACLSFILARRDLKSAGRRVT